MIKIAVIIFSCFKYRYLWNTVIKSWERELANDFSNFDFYITTDTPKNSNLYNYLNNKNVKFIVYPNKLSWTEAAFFSLKNLNLNKYKNIITTFDDLIITKIDRRLLFNVINKNENINYFRLINNHSNLLKRFLFYKEFEVYYPKQYLGSMVMTLWDLEFLIQFLSNHKKELLELNAWEYEKNVPEIIGKYPNLKYSNRNIINYLNLMLKGKIDLISLYYFALVKQQSMKTVYDNYSKLKLFKNLLIYFYYLIFEISQLILPNLSLKNFSKLKEFLIKLR